MRSWLAWTDWNIPLLLRTKYFPQQPLNGEVGCCDVPLLPTRRCATLGLFVAAIFDALTPRPAPSPLPSSQIDGTFSIVDNKGFLFLYNSYPDAKARTLRFDSRMGMDQGSYLLTLMDATQAVGYRQRPQREAADVG